MSPYRPVKEYLWVMCSEDEFLSHRECVYLMWLNIARKKIHFVKMFLAAFIHSAKYLLVIYWMSGIVLGTENTAVNKTDRSQAYKLEARKYE